MTAWQRVLVLFSTITTATLLYWYFGSLWFYLVVSIGIFFLIKGGKQHV
ncbi:MAG: hypothetical protein JXB08_03230 [Bacilli bacterium]|nr:hypothetical protein [Bacilli bacterium]MBN2876302.1 hypothetical protein [Bacilli bacterium]